MQAANVDFFISRMNRLKTALGVSKDKEVAAALGLGDKALNARKARNSFPEKELIDLANARPDLRLNLDFILDGTPQPQETQDDFIDRQRAINTMAALIDALPLPEIRKSRMSVVLTGEPLRDAAQITASLLADPLLPEGDRTLLANFHAAPSQVQAGIKTTLGAFTPAPGVKGRKRAA